MIASGVVIRRGLDGPARARRPLRLEIRRRRAVYGSGGVERYVTELLFGEEAEAVLVPRGTEPVGADRLAVVEARG